MGGNPAGKPASGSLLVDEECCPLVPALIGLLALLPLLSALPTCTHTRARILNRRSGGQVVMGEKSCQEPRFVNVAAVEQRYREVIKLDNKQVTFLSTTPAYLRQHNNYFQRFIYFIFLRK